jgi:hypothetical protein
MLDTLQPQSLTSYIKEIRKIEPVRKPAMIAPVKTQIEAIVSKTREPADLSDLPFEKWNLPAQQEGYIKCGRHNFL